jgi:hypothetical protein
MGAGGDEARELLHTGSGAAEKFHGSPGSGGKSFGGLRFLVAAS